MYRVVIVVLALAVVPAVAAAQQPCTTDARNVVNELYRHMLERQADPASDWNDDGVLSRAELVGVGGARTVPTTGTRITVDARQRWVDTGLFVERGDVILFDASGDVRLSNNGNDVAGPAGAHSGRRAPQAPLASQLAGALIGRIGETEFAIGNQASMTAPASGRLFLGVNDDHLADNEGHFEVFVSVR